MTTLTAAAQAGTNWEAVGAIATAASAIATVIIVVFTYAALQATRQTARQASEDAREAISHANSRAERDLYRDNLMRLAEYLPEVANDVLASPTSLRVRTLLTVLPPEPFPLPATRYAFNAEHAPCVEPAELGASHSGSERLGVMARELAHAIHKLSELPG